MVLIGTYIWATLGLLLVVILGWCFWWRLACARSGVPWPHQLAFMLENPYMKWVCPSRMVVDRLRLSPGLRVMDVGCGAGRISVPVSKEVGERGEVVAVDCQPGMLKKLQHRMVVQDTGSITPYLLDIRQDMPLGPFDRICLVTVLGEMPHHCQLELLANLHRRLACGGVISITEVIPDPCYIPRGVLESMFVSQGFKVKERFEKLLCYTVNFVKNTEDIS